MMKIFSLVLICLMFIVICAVTVIAPPGIGLYCGEGVEIGHKECGFWTGSNVWICVEQEPGNPVGVWATDICAPYSCYEADGLVYCGECKEADRSELRWQVLYKRCM
jgi:hypothetical protein